MLLVLISLFNDVSRIKDLFFNFCIFMLGLILKMVVVFLDIVCVCVFNMLFCCKKEVGDGYWDRVYLITLLLDSLLI